MKIFQSVRIINLRNKLNESVYVILECTCLEPTQTSRHNVVSNKSLIILEVSMIQTIRT